MYFATKYIFKVDELVWMMMSVKQNYHVYYEVNMSSSPFLDFQMFFIYSEMKCPF